MSILLTTFLDNVRSQPNAVAIVDDKGSTTYAQLAAQATRIALLIEASTEQRSVGILLPACSTFAACFYGALMAGRAIVPINFLLSPQQIGHMVIDSGIDLILSAPPLAEKFTALPVKVIDLAAAAGAASGEAGHAMPPALPGATSDADSLAVMLYTSGTSGMPKGVPLSHANLHAAVEGCIRHVFRGSNHRFLGLAPLFHSTGFTGTLLAPMRLGCPVHYIARFSPVATHKAIVEQRCDIIIGVPSMYGAMMNLKSAKPEDFAHTFALICGGEPLSAALRDAFQQRFGKPLLQGYGLSETCGPIAVNAPHACRDDSVGQLIPAAKVRIASETTGDVLPVGATGEIQLGGPSVMKGYHHLPEATAEAMTTDGYFRTGDLGHVDADGFIFVTGRAKDMIIVSGEKLAPRELEELLAKHPAIAEVAVVPRKDESRGEVPVAFVVAREGQTIDTSSVRDHLKPFDLPNWKLPKDVIVIDSLPRSPTGKVLKRELVARL